MVAGERIEKCNLPICQLYSMTSINTIALFKPQADERRVSPRKGKEFRELLTSLKTLYVTPKLGWLPKQYEKIDLFSLDW